ncbi:MAG: hypothetical protein EB084_22750 [Proteobacteria bacterium]|nr:hypothetical protein [Pseudomonadota bacterium]
MTASAVTDDQTTASSSVTVKAAAASGSGSQPAASVSPAARMASAQAATPARPLGVNLEFVRDWSRSQAFVDVIKSSRRFGTVSRFWDTPCAVDANGWPTTDFGVTVFTDVPNAAGTYLLSFNGRAQVGCYDTQNLVRNPQYNAATDTTTAEVVVGKNPMAGRGDGLSLRFTGTTNGCRNIRLLRPGYALDTRELYSDAFIRRLAPFTVLRTMQMQSTVDSPLKTWSDRVLPSEAQQTTNRGVALEYLAQLANRTQKDLWICVPDQADDTYVRNMATLLKGTLNSNRVIYLEWSNEVWNGMYQEAQRNMTAARTEGQAGPCPLNDFGSTTNQGYWAWRRVARRSIEIGAIFKQVFGTDASRVRLVLPHQTENTYMLFHQLLFVSRYYGAPSQYFYGVAGAPYFGIDPANRNETNLSVDRVIALCGLSLDRIIATRLGFDPTFQGVLDWNRLPTQLSLARFYGLRSLAYEGGPDTAVSGPESLASKIAANRDPRMADMVARYLNTWFSNGNDLFCYFILAQPENQNGHAGIYFDITLDTPKSRALNAIASGTTTP